MGKLATKNSTGFRVGTAGNTPKAVGWVKEEYGVDIGKMGHYTKDELRALGEYAKDMKLQAEWAREALKHIEQIIQYRNEINKLRMEALNKGIEGKEEVDKYVLSAILKTHGHEAHIKKIFQDMRQGMALIDAKSHSSLSLGQQSFQEKIREIAAKHQHASRAIRDAGQAAIGDLGRNERMARMQAKKRKDLLSYIRADDYDPTRSAGGRRNWFSGWFA